MKLDEIKFLDEVRLKDDELLVILGGNNDLPINCGLGCGESCGRGCGSCTPSKPGTKPAAM